MPGKQYTPPLSFSGHPAAQYNPPMCHLFIFADHRMVIGISHLTPKDAGALIPLCLCGSVLPICQSLMAGMTASVISQHDGKHITDRDSFQGTGLMAVGRAGKVINHSVGKFVCGDIQLGKLRNGERHSFPASRHQNTRCYAVPGRHCR